MRYVINYKQTEYRKMTVDADTVLDAMNKWKAGDGQDEFVSTGGDAEIMDDIEVVGPVPPISVECVLFGNDLFDMDAEAWAVVDANREVHFVHLDPVEARRFADRLKS